MTIPLAPASTLDLSSPTLKITGMHLRGLGPLASLKLPQGAAWGSLSDLVVVHGPNGCGKTTLLEFLAQAAACMTARTWPVALNPQGDSWVEFKVCGQPGGQERVQFRIGSAAFLSAQLQAPSYDVCTHAGPEGARVLPVSDRSEWIKTLRRAFPSATLHPGLPYVAYFPSDRSFTMPRAAQRVAAEPEEPLPFFFRWQPPKTWAQSLEAQLYAARWHDLNASAEGRPEEATRQDAFTQAMDEVTQGAKRLVWIKGQLWVEIVSSGARHELASLSAGELQLLVFSVELRRWWRPGSLILIDEPELHLHASWQHRLLELLTRWRQERGGQVILCTLSDTLAQAVSPEQRVALPCPP